MLASIAALPLFAFAIYQAIDERAQGLERAREEALLTARAHAALQATIIERTRFVLAGFAAGLTFDPPRPDCAAVLRRVVTANPMHVNASVADRQGRLRCSVEPLTKPVEIADRAYFKRALANEFTVSGLLTSRVSGGPRVAAAHPITDERGEVAGVLIATFDTSRLEESLQSIPTTGHAVVALVDSEGRQIARHPRAAEHLGRQLPGFDPRSTASGYLDFVGLDGVDRIAAYTRLRAEVPLYVVAGLPRAEVEREPRQALARNVAILLIVLCAALGISYFGAHRLIVAPLRTLTRAAQRYGAGDLEARSGLEREVAEIGTLARTFDYLAEQNQRTTRALRTLSAGNRTVLREKDEGALMAAMCRVAVEEGGYRLAFVNHAREDEEKSVVTLARAGEDRGFIDSLDLTWADSERGRGSVGTAIRTGHTCVIRSMARDPRFAPWREAAVANGLGSVASFPLRVEGAVIGTFTLVAAEEDAFDGPELQLLDEMAADLSFGIEVLRSNARRAAAEERARYATTHDAITALPGRIPFLLATKAALRAGQRFAVVVVNLPGLQDLHDSLGYTAVDEAVIEAATRLKAIVGPARELSRLSTDDFAMLLGAEARADLTGLARRVHALFEAAMELRGVRIELRVAIGAALFPEHGDGAEMLLRRASIAAREAARTEQPFLLYEGSSEREDPERLKLAHELRRAIEERQLELHFQAKVDLAGGRLRGAEALVRWPHPTRGMVPPMQFVPIAEQTGLIRPLTSMVIELAVKQLQAWDGRALRTPIAVNLSPRNLHDPGLVERIDRLLSESHILPGLLEFEITESALARDPRKATEVLQRLRALGCKLYIDDFGTGYSSLSTLMSLPVNAIKIDRSFVRNMAKSGEAHSVVASIVLMASALGLGTVAEGVETREDAELLRKLGCEEAQGFFFAKPVAASEFRRQ